MLRPGPGLGIFKTKNGQSDGVKINILITMSSKIINTLKVLLKLTNGIKAIISAKFSNLNLSSINVFLFIIHFDFKLSIYKLSI